MSRLFVLISMLLLLVGTAWPASAALYGESSNADGVTPHVYTYDGNRKTAQTDNAVRELEASHAFIPCALDAEQATTTVSVHRKPWCVNPEYLATVSEIGEWIYHYDDQYDYREVIVWPSGSRRGNDSSCVVLQGEGSGHQPPVPHRSLYSDGACLFPAVAISVV